MQHIFHGAGDWERLLKLRLKKLSLSPTTQHAAPRSSFIQRSTSLADELRGAIATGKIAPGNRLAEAQLALSLKVGRVPLRDALRRLEVEGYITAVSHDQFMVSQLTLEDAEEYYSIAGSLGLAARLAVEKAAPKSFLD